MRGWRAIQSNDRSGSGGSNLSRLRLQWPAVCGHDSLHMCARSDLCVEAFLQSVDLLFALPLHPAISA